MKLKEIHRTSTFAWSPFSSLPLLATGTVAGALDESFSNESKLEVWAPDFFDKDEFDLGLPGLQGPKGYVSDNARFNRLAWGHVDGNRPQGVIAAGLENGELALWDPASILAGGGASGSLILRNSTHAGPVRGLDFNPIQGNLLASGAVGGEVYIWDLKDPSKPYSPTPGQRTTKLDEITSLAWNQQVQYVLAGASSSGYTVVWDLRGKREVVALAYGGGAGTLAGQTGAGLGMAVGGRRGMSDIAWHPDNATRVVTASEDDSSPIIMVWDLRNARAPEKILTGHEKGVLSLSWCKQDADLLLSCGKDNRALCWNPQTSEIIGELPSAANWAFQVDWCPRNPDMLATAFFDGTIGIHSLQSTNEAIAQSTPATRDSADIFDTAGFSGASQHSTLSLKQPPKWLRRPVSSSFGFGGKLVTVSNLPSAQGKTQSNTVHLRKVITEASLVDRAKKLQDAITSDNMQSFAESAADGGEAWMALLSLFKTNSREELVASLGFSKEEIAARVVEAVESLKISKASSEQDLTFVKPHESVVSFAEPPSDRSDVGDDSVPPELTPSEVSTGVTSDTASAPHADGESTTTAPSLFGDDILGTPQHDFFSLVGPTQHVPHLNYGLDSSVAATMGSGPSSITSETMKSGGFRIYPADEADIDKLISKAVVLGDFESAVTLCLSSDRFADAILLAVRGGQDLLQRTQRAYFDRRAPQSPSLRLVQSIVTNDLGDIVQNADLQEWRDVFVVLCTFASEEEFPTLAEQLGSRLEYHFKVTDTLDPEVAQTFRKNATLTYLAATRLERLVSLWVEEMVEEEKVLISDGKLGDSYYSAHAQALQTFIEKVAVFRAATKYVDAALDQNATTGEPPQAYKLATLYDRYFEYAEILSTQGMVKEAVEFMNLTPAGYNGSPHGPDLASERKRYISAATLGLAISDPPASTIAGPSKPAGGPTVPRKTFSGFTGYTPAVHPTAPQQPTAFPSYESASTVNSYPPVQHQGVINQATAPSGYQNRFAVPQNTQVQPQLFRPQRAPAPTSVPPPPRAANGTPSNVSATPPPKREAGGWNDAPALQPARVPAALNLHKPAAITSPFPNAASPGYSPQASPFIGQASATLPPPPRPGSVNRGPPPPPAMPPQRIRSPGMPTDGILPPQVPPPSMIGHQVVAPPSQLMSSPQGPPAHLPQPPLSQHAPFPPSRLMGRGQTPPPGSLHRASSTQPPPSNPYGPPPSMGMGGAHTQYQQPPPNPYAPQGIPQQQSPVGQTLAPPPPPPPPPGAASTGGPPRALSRAGVSLKPQTPAPKHPPGDRSHIPDYARPAYESISEHLNRLKQTTPSNQKRVVDDLERRINPLFDALNCETLSRPVVDQLVILTQAMDSRDRANSLAIHVDLLTRGSQTDDIGMWMSGIKQLIMRL